MGMVMNPQSIADKQVANTQAATTAYTNGINSVTVAPGAQAAAQKQKYLNGVMASADIWARNVSAVTLQQWQALAAGKGSQRLGQGVAAAKAKIVSFWSNFLPKLQQVQANVRAMDSSTYEARKMRAVANMDGLHALKGTLSQ